MNFIENNARTKEQLFRTTVMNWTYTTYLLLTEFEGRTEATDRVFSPSIYGRSVKREGHKSKGRKREIRNVKRG